MTNKPSKEQTKPKIHSPYDWLFRPKDPFKPAIWKRGKQTCRGAWYYQGNDRFVIKLKHRTFRVVGDRPEWGGWKFQNRVPEEAKQ
jgi:hypothetical protein